MSEQLIANYLKLGLISAMVLFIARPSLAQCPDALFLSTSKQLVDFAMEYPDCSVIAGNIIIDGFDTGRLMNLDGLKQLKIIEGSLFIGNHLLLNDLSALQQLEKIGGDLIIINNPSLQEISSFINLSRIEGSLRLINCPQMEQVYFPALQAVEENLIVFFNARLQTLSGFESLERIGEDLHISRNPYLTNLKGLEELERIEGDLMIFRNPFLRHLSGLDNLTGIQERIIIIENDSLSDCKSGFCYRFLPTQQLTVGNIKENACGCNSARELRTICRGDTVNCNPTYTIAGNIQTPNKKPISNVTVRLNGPLESAVLTDENGKFQFKDLPEGEYFVALSRTEDYINGVTIVDASLIINHANGTPPLLNDPYKVLAVDIDQSKSITLEDGNLVKRLAQGAIEEWETVASWGFIRADIDFGEQLNNPWLILDAVNGEGAILHIPSLQKDHLTANFIGYKYGDANDSVEP